MPRVCESMLLIWCCVELHSIQCNVIATLIVVLIERITHRTIENE